MNEIIFPPANEIPKSHPYDLCMYFSKGDKIKGYFTYLAYKDYKLAWIKEQKKIHDGKEPTQKELEHFKNGLLEKNYEDFINRADQNVRELFAKLVQEELTRQLPDAISSSNFNEIKKIMKVCAVEKSGTEKYLGNAIHEIHNATTHKCKSFWIAIVTSALGTFCLAIIFVLIELLFKVGLFQKLYSLIVPM